MNKEQLNLAVLRLDAIISEDVKNKSNRAIYLDLETGAITVYQRPLKKSKRKKVLLEINREAVENYHLLPPKYRAFFYKNSIMRILQNVEI